MKKAKPELTVKQKAQLAALETLPDDQIDASDIPENADWSNGIRDAFYHPCVKMSRSRE